MYICYPNFHNVAKYVFTFGLKKNNLCVCVCMDTYVCVHVFVCVYVFQANGRIIEC